VTEQSTPRYVSVHLSDVDGYADDGRPSWHMVRSSLGIESFGINAWRATEAGQDLIGEHDELGDGAAGHEELYLVHSGSATFTVDGETIPAPAGTIVYVRDPAVKRKAIADEGGTVVLVVGGAPGQAFTVSSWERAGQALRYWTTQEWNKAIAVLEQQHAEDPESAGVLYNLACAESRGGRTDAALEHLARAIELQASFAENAQSDVDFDPIKADPRFPAH
jgi:tetratricopeptide (TPR) repeat protein